MYVEVLEVEDIHRSPVPPKLMNSLRHTKSEENLGGGVGSANAGETTSLSAFSICGQCDDPDPEGCWSQEDDEISQQVRKRTFIISSQFVTQKLNYHV